MRLTRRVPRVGAPLRLRGSTGSPMRPLAMPFAR